MKRTLTFAAALTLATLGAVTPAHAAGANTFSSCAKLNRVFPHGVAKSPAAAAVQVRDGYGRPATTARARQVYATNHSRLDRDGDGTACER